MNRTLRKAALAAMAAFPMAAAAQDSAQKVERIEVTGSSIKRIDGETALPVTVITKADIERSGATTAVELLQLISANSSSGMLSPVNSIGAFTNSAQTASLRSLGGGRTLVLVNGKRASGFAGEVGGVQGVNLAVIPFSAVERVEVLKDGASAIYGSDAIGGVINFILRADYQGGELTGYYGMPTRSGGGEQESASVAAGFGDLAKDRYNLLVSLSYNHQAALDQRDRNFSNTAYRPDINLASISSNTFPARITTGGIGAVRMTIDGVATLAGENCAPSSFILGGCFYDPSTTQGVNGIPDGKTVNFFASGRYRIGNDWEAFGSVILSRDESHYTIQPAPISSVFFYGPLSTIPSTILLPPGSRYYPTALAEAAGVGGQPLDVRWRAFEAGLRDTTDTNTAGQLVLGVKGTWANWDAEAAYIYGEGRTVAHDNGGKPDLLKILPLLNSGNVNLFGPNTPEITQQILATNFIGDALDAKAKNYGLQGKASRELFKLPGGAAAVAFGGEIRKETLDQKYAAELQGGTISGYGGAFPNISGERDIKALFGEMNLPILKGFEANVAVRWDDYSDFGSTTNPKVSLRWQPAPQVLARASYGTGFLAPSLYQLFIPNSGGVTQNGISDPIRCPVTGNVGIDCLTQFTTLNGGNAALKPEESEQATAGIVLEPTRNLSFSVDYWKIRLSNAIINGIPVTTILGDLDAYGYLVTRGAVDPAFPTLPGRITSINQTYLNLGSVHMEGLDFEAHWKVPQTGIGRLQVDFSGTYTLRNDIQNPDGTYTGFISDQFGAVTSGVIPRWKHYVNATLETGAWSFTLANLYQSKYRDVNPDPNGDYRYVSSMTLWDAQVVYRGFKNLALTLGVKNLLDTDPPVTNQATTFQVGFDPSYYDARARFVFLQARYNFK